jgi:hypothetical protein
MCNGSTHSKQIPLPELPTHIYRYFFKGKNIFYIASDTTIMSIQFMHLLCILSNPAWMSKKITHQSAQKNHYYVYQIKTDGFSRRTAAESTPLP